MIYRLASKKTYIKEKIYLASSKSESNRALIINALTEPKGQLHNLSSARDTQTMIRLLEDSGEVADVLDAGTTMRFLTAYFSVSNQTKTMTGTPRMCQRPIGLLTDALNSLGVEIDFLAEKGYPPHKIKGFKTQKTKSIEIRGDVSSQYISALLMIAPKLSLGLELKLTGHVGSIPYIKMTIAQMRAFGVEVIEDWDNNILSVAPQAYKPCTYRIESDWSGASYWYSVVALSPFEDTEVKLMGLYENSLQGDAVIVQIMEKLGVKSVFDHEGVSLTKTAAETHFSWDFSNCPDLAQTVAVVLVAKGIDAEFTGIESLKIKETDRVLALQNELAKLGGTIEPLNTNDRYSVKRKAESLIQSAQIHTYDDHRMAMAFAPLAMLTEVFIEEPDVVAKSYPSFWDDFSKISNIESL
jgi:3-phosphoshikimate 1-carboxyvinyltransferase